MNTRNPGCLHNIWSFTAGVFVSTLWRSGNNSRPGCISDSICICCVFNAVRNIDNSPRKKLFFSRIETCGKRTCANGSRKRSARWSRCTYCNWRAVTQGKTFDRRRLITFKVNVTACVLASSQRAVNWVFTVNIVLKCFCCACWRSKINCFGNIESVWRSQHIGINSCFKISINNWITRINSWIESWKCGAYFRSRCIGLTEDCTCGIKSGSEAVVCRNPLALNRGRPAVIRRSCGLPAVFNRCSVSWT